MSMGYLNITPKLRQQSTLWPSGLRRETRMESVSDVSSDISYLRMRKFESCRCRIFFFLYIFISYGQNRVFRAIF